MQDGEHSGKTQRQTHERLKGFSDKFRATKQIFMKMKTGECYRKGQAVCLNTECTILTTTVHEDLLYPRIYTLALCMYVYVYLCSAHVYSHPCSAYAQFLLWLTAMLFQECRDIEIQKTMCSNRFSEEGTYHNSYDMCTLPNLFKMNPFQQQRHMKRLSFCECCNEHYIIAPLDYSNNCQLFK